MVEHGKCANGSSSDLCGAYAVGLDAMVSSKDVKHPGRIYRGVQVSLIVSMLRTLKDVYKRQMYPLADSYVDVLPLFQ